MNIEITYQGGLSGGVIGDGKAAIPFKRGQPVAVPEAVACELWDSNPGDWDVPAPIKAKVAEAKARAKAEADVKSEKPGTSAVQKSNKK